MIQTKLKQLSHRRRMHYSINYSEFDYYNSKEYQYKLINVNFLFTLLDCVMVFSEVTSL